jgi:protoporphyrin/coproporphyrin ferrochelatase
MLNPIGVLLTNIGTPDAPTSAAVRRYLRQFLSDRRVVDLPRPLWWPLLHLFILPLRSPRSARAYAAIWTPDGSPLLAVARGQAQAVELALRTRLAQPVHVALGMGYGNPSLGAGLEALRDRGCWRVLLLPLFPQYSSPTTGSAFDGVTGVLRGWRRVPELRFVSGYHDHPGYVAALAASVRERWDRDGEPDRLLLSFHGLPQRYVTLGDPYRSQCEETARLLVAALGLGDGRATLAYQSRFGREEWLKPYTDETLKAWGQSGVATVDVVAPGFAADCLETLEEIGIRYRETFLRAGGRRFRYLPALNARPDHVAALADVALRQLGGWDGATGSALAS